MALQWKVAVVEDDRRQARSVTAGLRLGADDFWSGPSRQRSWWPG